MKADLHDLNKHQQRNSRTLVRIFPEESKASTESISVGYVYWNDDMWYWHHTASNITSSYGFLSKIEATEDLRRVGKEYLNIPKVNEDV